MSTLDWLVLGSTLAAIVGYGLWRSRGIRTVDAYLRGGTETRFYTVALSIMATQASAVTFLSMPGQAYEDGLGFVQFYFGLPIAMVLICAFVLPVYHRLRVYTAYEYLEQRFDQKTRQLTAGLFLVSRGLAVGLSIYAPAIILSTVFGWPLRVTAAVIGAVAILYTVSGGTRAVSQTQTGQMTVMLGGMLVAFVVVLRALPHHVSVADALHVAGTLGKLKAVDPSLRLDTRYTLWSGLTGGLFVALAYFGTDQSQVQRYLAGADLRQSRLGLLVNGMVKVPMQLLILLVGVALFVFYQFNAPPIFWNDAALTAARSGTTGVELQALEASYADVTRRKQAVLDRLLARDEGARAPLVALDREGQVLRDRARAVIARVRPAESKDQDYVFISFVTKHFPRGLVGLLVAVILCAALSSTASALNALGSTSVVDFYRRSIRPEATDAHYLFVAKLFTVGWGVVGLGFSLGASLFDNLIQAVNILGSLFYGPMLGVFALGLFVPRVRGTSAFVGVIVAQLAVVAVAVGSSIGYLWYNVVGAALCMGVAVVVERIASRTSAASTTARSESSPPGR